MSEKISGSQLANLVSESHTFVEVARKLGLKKTQYKQVKRRIQNSNLDTSHFDPLNWIRRPLEEILVRGSDYQSTYRLKKRLMNAGMLKNKCYECGQKPFWNGKELVLQLDHINGHNTDHRLENLRILCPNCHTQTPTYGARNLKNASLKNRQHQ